MVIFQWENKEDTTIDWIVYTSHRIELSRESLGKDKNNNEKR